VASVSVRIVQNGEAGRLESAKERVLRLEGIRRVLVDHANDLLTAEYDPDRVSYDAIRKVAVRENARAASRPGHR